MKSTTDQINRASSQAGIMRNRDAAALVLAVDFPHLRWEVAHFGIRGVHPRHPQATVQITEAPIVAADLAQGRATSSDHGWNAALVSADWMSNWRSHGAHPAPTASAAMAQLQGEIQKKAKRLAAIAGSPTPGRTPS